jgi:uroporphyrinogen-III synthase
MVEVELPLIVLTRPEGRNESIAAALKARGMRVMVLPALTLETPDDQLAPAAADYDLVVFVSRQAVTAYFASVGQAWPRGTWAAAVGQATARALREYVPAGQIIVPEASSEQDSEALLAVIDRRNQRFDRVLILRGQNGREWLAEALERGGAQVTRHAMYRRVPARWTRDQYLEVFSGNRGIMLLTSIEGLEAVCGGAARHGLSWPAGWRFVVIHARIARRLQSLMRANGASGEAWVNVCVPDEAAIFQAILAASR